MGASSLQGLAEDHEEAREIRLARDVLYGFLIMHILEQDAQRLKIHCEEQNLVGPS